MKMKSFCILLSFITNEMSSHQDTKQSLDQINDTVLSFSASVDGMEALEPDFRQLLCSSLK
jgi:hypothetical protein